MTENIPGIISAWYDGQAQGKAIADVLFGEYNPGGKLTSTWYKSVTELPAMDHYDIKENRTYLYYTGTPLFPFGYGLSYTTFDYSNILVNKPVLSPGDTLMVSATIKNTGLVAGDEVPQFYVHHLLPGIKRPLKELKDFQRIYLQPGEIKTVTFKVTHSDLAYYDEKSKAFYTQEGSLEILVGSSSEDIRLQAQIQVKGEMVEETFRMNAFSLIEAEYFERKSKPIVITANGKGGQSIGIMAEGDFVVYRNLDFSEGATHFDAYMEVNSGMGQGGVLEIRLDSVYGPITGLIRLNDLGTEPGYKQISCNVIGADGIRDVFLVFHKSAKGYCKVDWFRFRQVLPVNEGDQYDIQLFPNPASQTFSIRYGSAKPYAMQVEIFTMQGILKHALLYEPNMPGIAQVSINTEDAGLKQGMYIIRCTVNNYSKSFQLCIVQ
jgi:beta-glucosidase